MAPTLKELKEVIEQTNDKLTALDERIRHNHEELITKIEKVEQVAKQALITAEKNEARLYELEEANEKQKKETEKELKSLKESIMNEINIPRLEAQLKATLIEIEDLRNRSMRSTLIFKNIKEEHKETWEDTTRILTNYIVDELGLEYTHDEIDFQLSRSHRGTPDAEGDTNETSTNHRGPRPIYAQFVNWRIAEEIRSKVIYMHSRKQSKVVVNQMFSKELTKRRNTALSKRKELLQETPNLQIRLDYPAVLRSRRKNSNDKWQLVGKF